jgi:hypothetical protein
MVPYGSCTEHMAPIWPPYGACAHLPHQYMAPIWHVRLPYSHFWLPYGCYTAQGAPIWHHLPYVLHHPPYIWHTWHPYGVVSSTQCTWLLNAPSVFYLASHGFHMACMAPIWCTRLLYSSHSSIKAHMAPIWCCPPPVMCHMARICHWLQWVLNVVYRKSCNHTL